jgi:hypothetical protein
MRIRLPLAAASIALAFALSVAPADAATGRVGTLTLTCDGTVRHESFQATGLGASVNRFIQGAEVTVVDRKGKLEYLLVRAEGDENSQLLSIGPKVTHESVAFTASLFQVTTDATGNVLITVDALCRKGPDLTAFVNVTFFS